MTACRDKKCYNNILIKIVKYVDLSGSSLAVSCQPEKTRKWETPESSHHGGRPII